MARMSLSNKMQIRAFKRYCSKTTSSKSARVACVRSMMRATDGLSGSRKRRRRRRR